VRPFIEHLGARVEGERRVVQEETRAHERQAADGVHPAKLQ
jgi:hypothetical protein